MRKKSLQKRPARRSCAGHGPLPRGLPERPERWRTRRGRVPDHRAHHGRQRHRHPDRRARRRLFRRARGGALRRQRDRRGVPERPAGQRQRLPRHRDDSLGQRRPRGLRHLHPRRHRREAARGHDTLDFRGLRRGRRGYRLHRQGLLRRAPRRQGHDLPRELPQRLPPAHQLQARGPHARGCRSTSRSASPAASSSWASSTPSTPTPPP